MFNWLLLLIDILIAVPSACHALLSKRDPRSALAWMTICLMFPLAGPVFYFFFGVNRIRTRARKLEADSPFKVRRFDDHFPKLQAFQIPPPLDEIARISDAIVKRPLICGNTVTPLSNGEAAYPAMLSAIDGARRYVYLSTYIFETDRTGHRFIDALDSARKRGVDVRVIIDGVGEWYAVPRTRAGTILAQRGVRFVRFLPPKLFPPTFQINLRNHRKILVTDDREAFVGGMNIGDRHLADTSDPRRVMDLHFHLTGPIVHQITQVFLEDWRFSAREETTLLPYREENRGDTICRAVVDGPNVRIDRLSMILVSAVSAARRKVVLMTPYFLPSAELTAALQAAALRGVAVHVVLPGKNNLPFVHWATMNTLAELLQYGVLVYLQPPPFVHTKLVIVDDHYAQIGSANIDPRSLRLNFELMVEIYGRKVVGALSSHAEEKRSRSRMLSSGDIENRSLPVRLRDAAAWLFSPYL